jgi:hypothetical protein
MSKYAENATNMTEECYLVEALKAMGFQPVVHEQPVHLQGYMGDNRPEVATVVIPKAQVGEASNDIGFLKVNGTYQATISGFDSRSRGYNQTWLGQLAQNYTEKRMVAQMQAKGYIYQGTKMVEKKKQLLFGVR